jgi:serine phosphatase RsbU (regulator of sigma subunit)
VQLEPGATLVLYTDGLIERRGQSLDHGLQRLAAIATSNHDQPETLITAVLEAMNDGTWTDDVFVLALRLQGR